MPIFVVTHEPPAVHPKENDRLTLTFVTDAIERAVALAFAAAGDKAVTVVGGAEINREMLRAGLELIDCQRTGARVSLKYRMAPR